MESQITQNNNRRQAVVPLVVRQILQCRQQDFRFFGSPVHIACLVGLIRNVQLEECQINCYIEDSTGTMKASIILETEEEARTRFSSITKNKYAQAFCSIRIINGERVLLVIKLFPIDDANVITCHLLQVICKRFEAEAELKQQVSSATSTGAALANSLAETETSVFNAPLRLTAIQEAIFNIIKTEDSDYGITKQNILRQFPSYQGHEVNQVLEFLINEGLIYPTTDQNHLKATDVDSVGSI